MEGILIALAVFLLSMDQQVLTRTLHRPLIACTIFGAILGDVQTGAAAGAAIELTLLTFDNERYFLTRPASVLYSCFAVLLAVKAGMNAQEASGAAIVFLGIGAGIAHLLSVVNLVFLQQARKAAETRNEKKLAAANFIPLILSGLVCAVIAFAGSASADSFVTAMENAGDQWGWILEGFAAAAYLLPLVGFAVLLRNLSAKDMPGAIFAGFACAVLAGSLLSYEAAAVVCAMIAFGIGAYDYHQNLKSTEKVSAAAEKTKKGDSKQWW